MAGTANQRLGRTSLAIKTQLTAQQGLTLARHAVVIASYCVDELESGASAAEAHDFNDAIDAFIAAARHHPYASYQPEHVGLRAFLRHEAASLRNCAPADAERLADAARKRP